ncbi:hypothetical protein C6P40_002232 [Pichia californica]|uniref:Thioredoxin domain-containing protein n=1 Tax=Pichia californica TaxID=460514 RepID=A0A9P6WNW8_9ASCO|nr:hypothetical protein C6P42_005231 [[Candida] californica]KAG0690600.1 hypothetical protein C6P40_002232 [[Candida] californica]
MYSVSIIVTLLLATLTELTEARQQHSKGQSTPFYTNSKHIFELSASNFNDYVYGSNYTTLVEFYAPWCGYCQKLRPDFEAASKEGHHYAQFAAINCDEQHNKAFCHEQGITGFPTLITYRPPKTFLENKQRSQQFAVQPYENDRSSSGIINAMKGQVKGFTKKVTKKNLDKLFTSYKEISSSPKVVFFTDSNQVSPMYKSLAIDYITNIEFFHVLNPNGEYLEMAKKYLSPEFENSEKLQVPILMVLDPVNDEIVVYDGELKKNHISKFLTKFGTPNDGDFSERAEIIKGIKEGSYKSFKDYRKKKSKAAKAAKAAKTNEQAEPKLVKDEL